MNRLSKVDSKVLRLIYEYHQSLLEKTFTNYIIALILAYKTIGMIICTHLFDTSLTNNDFNIPKILRYVTFCYNSNISCILNDDYSTLCFIIYFLIFINLIFGISIYKSYDNKYKKTINIMYLLSIFILVIFSSIINEILFIIILSFLPNVKDSHTGKIIEQFINNNWIHQYCLLVLNIMSIFVINVLSYILLCITNTPLFLSKTPITIICNNKWFKAFFIIITSNSQGLQLISVLYPGSRNINLLVTVIILVFLLFYLISLNVYYFVTYSYATVFYKLTSYVGIISGINNIVSYTYYPNGKENLELIEKILFEIFLGVLLVLVEFKIFEKKMAKELSENIFIKQKDVKKCLFSFMYFYEVILRLEKSESAYALISNTMYTHSEICKDKGCNCRETTFFNKKIKSNKEIKSEIYDWFEKEMSLLVNNILKISKIKSYYQIILTYCEFIYTIKHNCIKNSFYLEKYFKKIKSFPFDLKYCLYYLKKTIKCENLKKLKQLASKQEQYLVVANYKSFLKYERIIHSIKKCLFNNCDNHQKVLSLKNLNFNSVFTENRNYSKITLSSIYNICLQVNQGDNKLIQLIKDNFSANNPLNNTELCFLLTNYFSFSSKNQNNQCNIPESLSSIISPFDDKLLFSHKSFFEKDFTHPFILSLEDGKNYIFKYICHYLCLKLDYLPNELIDKSINQVLPEPFHSEHTNVVSKTILNKKFNYVEKQVFMIHKKGYYFPCMVTLSFFPTLHKLVKIIGNVNEIKQKKYHHYIVIDTYGNFLSYSDSLESAIMINREIIQKLKFNFFTLFNLNELIIKGYNNNKDEYENSIIQIKYDVSKLREAYIKISEYLKDDKCDMTIMNKIGEFSYMALNFTEESENKKIINELINEKTHINQKSFVDMNIKQNAIGNVQFYLVEYIETKEQFEKREQNGKFSALKKKLVLSRQGLNIYNRQNSGWIKPQAKISKKYINSNLTNSSFSVTSKKDSNNNLNMNNTNTYNNATNSFLLSKKNSNPFLKNLNGKTEDSPVMTTNSPEFFTINNFFTDQQPIIPSSKPLSAKSNLFSLISMVFFLFGVIIFSFIVLTFLNREFQQTKRLFMLNMYSINLDYILLYIGNIFFDSCLIFKTKDSYQIDTEIKHLEVNRDMFAEIAEEKVSELIESQSSLIKQLTIQNDVSLQIYLEYENYTVLNSDWNEPEALTTLYEEMSLFHNYLKLLTIYKGNFGYCHYDYYIEGTPKEEREEPNYNDKMVSYVNTNILKKMAPKFNRILLNINKEYLKLHNAIMRNLIIIDTVYLILFGFLFIYTVKRTKEYIKSTYNLAKRLIFDTNSNYDFGIKRKCINGENDLEMVLDQFKKIILNFEIFVLQNENVTISTITCSHMYNLFDSSFFINNNSSCQQKKRNYYPSCTKKISFQTGKRNSQEVQAASTYVSSIQSTSGNLATNAHININSSPNIDTCSSKYTKYSDKLLVNSTRSPVKGIPQAIVNAHYHKNLISFLKHLKKSFPYLTSTKIFMASSFTLYIIISAIHFYISIIENKSLIFSVDIVNNFCERTLKFIHLLLFYKISILTKNPNIEKETEEECLSKGISNPYNIEISRNDSFYSKINNSEYGCLLTLSQINNQNIKNLITRQKKYYSILMNNAIDDFISIEKKLDSDMYCIELSKYYYQSLQYESNNTNITINSIFKQISDLSLQCKLIGAFINQGGIQESINILLNNLNSDFLEFYQNYKENHIINYNHYLINNKNFLYNNINVIITLDKIQSIYYDLGMKNINNSYHQLFCEETIMILLTLLLFFIFTILVGFIQTKNSKIYKEIFKVVNKIYNFDK